MQRYQRVLLIGSSGFLGRCLYAALWGQAHLVPTHCTQTLFPESQTYDFWNDDLWPILENHKVDIIIMAASVAYAATDPAVDPHVFQQGVERLVQAAQGCRLVYVSSDGIFDGKQGLYIETDIPAPITAYGRNLQFFEACVQENCADYCIIRPSYLYGYAGSGLDHRLARVRADLLAGKTVSAFADMFKSPMEVNQVAGTIASLALSVHTGIVHVAGPRMSVYDFYREAMAALNVPCAHLVPATMPADVFMTRDTSLQTDLMGRLMGIEPLTIQNALNNRVEI